MQSAAASQGALLDPLGDLVSDAFSKDSIDIALASDQLTKPRSVALCCPHLPLLAGELPSRSAFPELATRTEACEDRENDARTSDHW